MEEATVIPLAKPRTAKPSAPRRSLQRIRFGEFLTEKNLITEEQLLAALGDHWSNGGRVGDAIVRLGFLSQERVEAEAARYHALDVIEI